MKQTPISFYRLLLLPLLMFGLPGCEDYLDIKPDEALILPNSLQDFQALLDNDFYVMNQEPALGFLGSDNYYIREEDWGSLLTDTERNAYIWAEEVFDAWLPQDWSLPYEQVFYANVVLEGLAEMDPPEGERAEWEGLKGSALFYRSYAFYALSQQFAAPYDPVTAAETPGIPLRLHSDIEAPVARASLQDTYMEIIRSGEAAVPLLPDRSSYPTRPDKAAAYALLARVALIMQDYTAAEAYATSSLALRDQLLDYNSLDTTAAVPFALFNEEVLFHSVLIPYELPSARALVDGELYSTYAEEDLRKKLFFAEEEGTGAIRFRGHYSGQDFYLFGGLATDEVYLIRAESRARLGDVGGAMEDLNRLLATRWREGSFEPFSAADAAEALAVVLQERRKELLFRGLRWSDLRRLQGDPRHAQTLERQLNGETYTLPPGSPRWVYPIPQQEIEISGIDQNPR
jgi:hypothetical protein